ncbi:MAG: hypothetical protein JWP57_2575 [Spirosoma sp.]|nr:hypothetical protein [Spirosoma sp.]
MVQQADVWHQQRLLTDAQLDRVRQAFPFDFGQTNGFIEVGLFLFTIVVIMSCYLLPASLITGLLDNSGTSALFNMGFGIVTGLIGRVLIKRRQLYRNGVDNAFVLMQTGFLAFGFNQLLPTNMPLGTYCLLSLPLLLLVLWYYGDTLIAFIAVATFYTFIFDSMLQFSWGKTSLPFVMMAVSGLLYLLARRMDRSPYYADPLNLVEWLALIVLAASGNYYVVREVNGLIFNVSIRQLARGMAPEIALPGLFWLLTILIPAAYLQQGLTRKNRMLIILGGLGLIAAVMTLQKYVLLLPLNVALTVGGLALIGIAVAAIWFLRQQTATDRGSGNMGNGFTDEPDYESPNEFFINMGTAAAMQVAVKAPHESKDDVRFGNGSFGGGGSEGNY